MSKQLSYSKKLKLLGIVALAAMFICYKLSYKKAIAEYMNYRETSTRLDRNKSLPLSNDELVQKEDIINSVFRQFNCDSCNDKLLGIIGDFSNRSALIVKEYRPLAEYKQDSVVIITRSCTVEGRFNNCVKLVHMLENSTNLGRVSSVQFRSYRGKGPDETHLSCTIYIQNILNSTYEN